VAEDSELIEKRPFGSVEPKQQALVSGFHLSSILPQALFSAEVLGISTPALYYQIDRSGRVSCRAELPVRDRSRGH
jgi:hypothetical protein